MIETIKTILPLVVVVSHVLLAIVLLSLIFRKSWGKDTSEWVGKHALKLGLLTSIGAIVGSLFYSNWVGFAPCDLCWWQRIFIYPQLVLFLVALKYRTTDVWKYVVPLSVISGVISLYHLFVQMGGNSILPCSASASCDKLYVFEFGYITIPTMSLTIGVTFLILATAHKLYENSNT